MTGQALWPRWIPPWLRRKGFAPAHIRQGIQMASTTLFIMATFSYPGIWTRFTIDNEFVSPMLIGIWMSVLFLVRPITRMGMFKMGVLMLLWGGLAVSMALAVMWITIGILGSYENSIGKAFLILVLSTPCLFLLVLIRIHKPANKFQGLIALLFFTLTLCGSYHTPQAVLNEFPGYLMFYCVVAVVFTWISTTFITPTPSGLMSRLALASDLRITGRMVCDVVALVLGPLNAEGRLAQVHGECAEGGSLNVDKGLYKPVMALHQASYDAGKRVTAGKLHLTLVHAHGDLIRDIGEQARRSLDAIANCLDKNAPIQPGLDSLVALHRGMAELVRALQTLPPELALEAESMAFHIMAINLLTATSQIRQLYQVLPAVLAHDQPDTAPIVIETLRRIPLADLRRAVPATVVSRSSAAGEQTRSAIGALRASFIGAISTRSQHGGLHRPSIGGVEAMTTSLQEDAMMRELHAKLEHRSITKLHPVAVKPPTAGDNALGWLTKRWGVTGVHLRIASQACCSYVIVMLLTAIEPVYNALFKRTVWAMIATMAVAETSIGAVYHKGLLRILGTILGAVLGLGTLYFAVLCNGLSHANAPGKFIITSLCLTVITGVIGTLDAWDPANMFGYMATCITLFGTALPGYAVDRVYWNYGLLRTVMTIVGVVVHMITTQCVFPVSSRQTLRNAMAGVLGSMGPVGSTMLGRLVPLPNTTTVHTPKSTAAGGTPRKVGGTPRNKNDSTPRKAPAPNKDSIAYGGRSPKSGGHGLGGRTPLNAQDSFTNGRNFWVGQMSIPAGSQSSLWAGLQRHGRSLWEQLMLPEGPEVIRDDHRPLGPVQWQLYCTIWTIAVKVANLAGLLDPLPYEFEVFHKPHRLRTGPAFKSQRLLRHILNTLMTFACSMDAQRLDHLTLLGSEAEKISELALQMEECLKGLQLMLQGRVQVKDALEALEALDYHTEHLFLHFVMEHLEDEPGTSKEQVIQTLSFISLLFNLSWVVRRLSTNLVYTFWGVSSPEGQLASSFFGDASRWVVDEDLLHAAQGALGLTLASEPSAVVGSTEDLSLLVGGSEGEESGDEVGGLIPPTESGKGLRPSLIHGSADYLALANSSALPTLRQLETGSPDGPPPREEMIPNSNGVPVNLETHSRDVENRV